MKRIELIDITETFINNSTPGKGYITYEKGFDFKKHKKEKETAIWLLDTFGGEIVVLKENYGYKLKNPDYKWNSKFWELKNVSSSISLENSLRKAIKQIIEKPGGIIIDISKYKDKTSTLYGVLCLGIASSNFKNILIILKNNSKLEKVYST